MIFLKDPGTSIDVPFDWTDSLATGVTLSSVVHTPPAGLTKVGEATDTANSKSTVRVGGGTNGTLYVVKAAGTLSSGEVIVKEAPVRVAVA